MRPLEAVYQIAFMVDALVPACERWAATTGAGPFFLFDPMTFIDPRLRGQPSDPGIAIALGFSGNLCIELIERRGTQPSVFDGTAPGQLHHVARLTDEIEAALTGMALQDFEVPFKGRFAPDTRMAFVDTRATIGCWTELIQFNADIEGALGMIEAAHAGWDGAKPCRQL